MTTRKEWINYVEKEDITYSKRAIVHDLFDSIELLQQHIAEFEAPKTCDGCKYYTKDMCNYNDECSRTSKDYYEPKETE